MRLGIVVVYLVNQQNERLLDLHLSQIARYTSAPYSIYAGVTRLAPRYRERLGQESNVRLVQPPATNLRGSREHAYFLDCLVKSAVEDDVTHVATLHMDSFPVRAGWAEEMAGHLSEQCVITAIRRDENRDHKPFPGGLLFHRDFYLAHRPTFRLGQAELASEAYRRYARAVEHARDSGVGYGFAVFQAGLVWHPLLRSNRAEDHFLYASVYGDLIFHLGAATRERKLFRPERKSLSGRRVQASAGGIRSWLRKLARRLPPQVRNMLSPRGRAFLRNQRTYEQVKEKLLKDPEDFLSYLRTGAR